MKDYVGRMMFEHMELAEKVKKLGGKLEDSAFCSAVGEKKVKLMRMQLNAMFLYLSILEERIELEIEEDEVLREVAKDLDAVQEAIKKNKGEANEW